MTGAASSSSRFKRVGLGLVCAGLCFAMAVCAQLGADRVKAKDPNMEVLYLPNEHLLNHLTAGLNTIIADLLWLDCIQYTAKENKGPRNFRWLEHMVFTTVRLDPHFKDAYRYGGIFLSALKADAKASMRLLSLGIPENPQAWELPYEIAMNYMLNRREEPHSKRYAAYYLGMSAATKTAPLYVAETAAKLQKDYNLNEVEATMWQQMLKSDSKMLRDLAERKLMEMQIRAVLPVLEQGAGIYRNNNGVWPKSVEDLLAAKIIATLPPEPLGGRYFFDADGKAYNTTLLDGERSIWLDFIREKVKKFKEDTGRWPESLEAVVRKGLLTSIPGNPYPGQKWKYDPATGTVD